MTLSRLLEGIPVTKMFQSMYGQMVVTHEVEVQHVRYDSRTVERNDLFVAVRGTGQDGHRFIDEAVNRGAKVVVVDDDEVRPDAFFMHAGVVKVLVPNTRRALARMSANLYGHPSGKLQLVGVTGTNGKTTTVYLIASMMEKAGLIGTIEYRMGDETVPATHTTPESVELNEMLARMVERGCSGAVMEVSSHALHQHRVEGLQFDAGVFTNLTQDHLDYHGTMEAYFGAKQMLFDGLDENAIAVTNADDEAGMKIVERSRAKRIRYGLGGQADVRAKDVRLGMTGTTLTIEHGGGKTAVTSSLIGRFNVYNILAAFATGIGLGISHESLQASIGRFNPVPGRFAHIPSPKGYAVVIDYAHTPDALQHCLEAIHDIFDDQRGTKGRVITVFGCGGNRDKSKRPKMGRIATELSDVTIVTSDNPRFEDPDSIIAEILGGVLPGAVVYHHADRRKAIEQALGLAGRGDVVLIAGKGHETYQVIGDERVPFSDDEVIREYLEASG